MVVTEQPSVVHQPFPFTTNSYWNEEIALGPGPPTKRGGNKNNASRTGSQLNMSSPDPSAGPPGVSTEEFTDALEDMVPKKEKNPSKNSIGDRWNWRRYQREDEILWGGEIKGSSVGLSGRGRASTGSSSSLYYGARNPEVNDLHPPVVCGPRTRAETRWMLQPPPTAKVMEGRVRSTNMVRDSSGGSLQSRRTDRFADSSPRVAEEGSKTQGSLEGKDRDQSGSSQLRAPEPAAPQSIQYELPPIVVSDDDPDISLQPSKIDGKVYVAPRLPLSNLATASHPPAPQQTSEGKHDTHIIPSPQSKSQPNLSFAYTQHGSAKALSFESLRWPIEGLINARPMSRGTADSGKAFHLVSPDADWPYDTNKLRIQSVHLEVTPDESDDESQEANALGRIRPWRWSMDI